MSHDFSFRPGTNDETMFRALMEHDEYHMPERFEPDDIVIDIGAHIGIFCYKALLRGSNQVHGFEAEPSNYECAVRNLKSFGDRVHLYHKAVWRSDQAVDCLYYTPSLNPKNTGGGNVLWGETGQGIPTLAFDDVLRQLTQNGRKRVRMVKIDCEGSEWPILLTSRWLHLVDYLAGEFHEIGGEHSTTWIPENAALKGYDRFTIEPLCEFLERVGFRVQFMRHVGTPLGLFHAEYAGGTIPRPALWRDRVRSAWNRLTHGSAAKP